MYFPNDYAPEGYVIRGMAGMYDIYRRVGGALQILTYPPPRQPLSAAQLTVWLAKIQEKPPEAGGPAE